MGIIIKTPQGNDAVYGHYDKAALNTSEGEKIIYSKGDAQPLNVELDFTADDMEISQDGVLYSSVTIPRPAGLKA
ncbi:MAG: hypothetical protein IJD80_04050, partial [Oscillospiraceae bacterium]|nr:hypothetical protein [Oscillospiraceae bacterium]